MPRETCGDRFRSLAAKFIAFTPTWLLPKLVVFGTALRERLVKIGARIGRHGRCLVFQLAEVVRRALFTGILRRIDRLRGPPVAAA
jgi:hypothetical protein